MTTKDIEKTIETLRKQGYSDEQITHSFINLYLTEKVNYEQCKALLNVLNYHLNEELDKMNDKKRKATLVKMLKK